MKQQRRIVLFYSCDSSDGPLCNELARFLRPLVREEHVEEWLDQQVPAGADVAQERKRAWESATHILLLLSADYLASEACYQEMLDALERQERGEVRVIPIRLHPCLLPSPLEESLVCLPSNGQAVSEWKERNQAFFKIARYICRILGLKLSSLRRLSTQRDRLLDKVFTEWIEGVLKPSLEAEGAHLELALREQPSEDANPWSSLVQQLHLAPRLLPAGRSIDQIYDHADGELLILGKPGAGKTNLLLELTWMLLARAEMDERTPMPVVFHLSSWAGKRQPVKVWLVEELRARYGVRPKIGQGWIDADQIIPLLDGLDEVSTEEARAVCVKEINDYYQSQQENQGNCPLVVCCRSEEYVALIARSTRLLLRSIVSIQPLTDEQISAYLEPLEEQGTVLKQALDKDPKLRELARQPLMLSVFTHAYQGTRASEIPIGASPDKMRDAIFARYVEQMLTRNTKLKRWRLEEVMHWLAFLAKSMQQEGQTLFSIEDLQPGWLTKKQKAFYRWGARFTCMLLGAVLGQLSYMLLGAVLGQLSYAYWMSPLIGALCGLLFAELNPHISLHEVLLWWRMTTGKEKVTTVEWWGPVVIVVLEISITHWHQSGPWIALEASLCCGLLPLLSIALLAGLNWGWPLVFSRSHEQRDSRDRALRRDAVARIFFVLVGVGMGALDGILSHAGLLVILFGALAGGWFFGISFILLTLVEHVSLRFWLWRSHCLPWKLVPFLDEMTNRLLFYKVDERYIFVHSLLRDHLARQEVLAASNTSQNTSDLLNE